jgi:hypothetical protein
MSSVSADLSARAAGCRCQLGCAACTSDDLYLKPVAGKISDVQGAFRGLQC